MREWFETRLGLTTEEWELELERRRRKKGAGE